MDIVAFKAQLQTRLKGPIYDTKILGDLWVGAINSKNAGGKFVYIFIVLQYLTV